MISVKTRGSYSFSSAVGHPWWLQPAIIFVAGSHWLLLPAFGHLARRHTDWPPTND